MQERTKSGVAIVAKGTDLPAIEQAIAEATTLIAGLGITPVEGEPP